jgi:hypothetical protein
MEAAHFSETSLNFHQSTKRHIPEDDVVQMKQILLTFMFLHITERRNRAKKSKVIKHHAMKMYGGAEVQLQHS